jgi:hypothetical protein
MGYNSHTVAFLWRATRIVAALCVVVWIIASGIAIVGDPNLSSHSPLDSLHNLIPPIILYLIPGAALFILASMARSNKLIAAPLIFLIGALSLFKLVLLATSLKGPYFTAPLSCELPARIACALLCVASVYAWEDLADIGRTRSRYGSKPIVMSRATTVHPPPRRAPTSPRSAPPQATPPPQKAPPQKTPQQQPMAQKPTSQKPATQKPPLHIPPSQKPPPPATSVPRPPLRRDEPPPSHTPWS